jgi:hypothetical protein
VSYVDGFESSCRTLAPAPGRTTKPPLTAVGGLRTVPPDDVTRYVHVVDPAVDGHAVSRASAGNEPTFSTDQSPPRPRIVNGAPADAASLLRSSTRTAEAGSFVPSVVPA